MIYNKDFIGSSNVIVLLVFSFVVVKLLQLRQATSTPCLAPGSIPPQQPNATKIEYSFTNAANTATWSKK